MLRAVESNEAAARRRRRISLRGVSRRRVHVVRGRRRGAAQHHDHGRARRGRADRRRAVRLAGLGAAPRSTWPASSAPTWAAAGASRRSRRATWCRGRRRRRRSTSSSGARSTRTISSSARSPRIRPDNFTAVFQLFDVLRGESLHGFQAADGPRRSAQSGASHLRHDLPGADGHSGRVQHADRVHQRRAAARQQQAVPPHRLGCRRRERAAHRRVGAAADVAGVVAGCAAARVRVVRGRRVGRLRPDAAHGHARARVGACRRQRLAVVLAGRPPARADAVARCRQSRHPHARPFDPSAAPAHDRRRDRYRSDLGARRPQHLFHVGSRRRPAGLSRRHGARRARPTRELRRQLQRAAAVVARRQVDRRRLRAEQHLSHRHRRSRERRLADLDATAGSTSRRASRRTVRRSFTRRVRTAAVCWRR